MFNYGTKVKVIDEKHEYFDVQGVVVDHMFYKEPLTGPELYGYGHKVAHTVQFGDIPNIQIWFDENQIERVE